MPRPSKLYSPRSALPPPDPPAPVKVTRLDHPSRRVFLCVISYCAPSPEQRSRLAMLRIALAESETCVEYVHNRLRAARRRLPTASRQSSIFSGATATRHGSPMTERPAYSQFGKTAQRWRDLADKRRAYFTELYRSGRWKLYYAEDEMLARMREVVAAAERWEEIAPHERS